jgi:Protein of unknown function (DUF3800)
MHLIYCDESGNTGTNLTDPAQPVFVLGALVVPEVDWRAVETGIEETVEAHFPIKDFPDLELHGADLSNPRKPNPLRDAPISARLACRDECLKLAQKHGLRLIYRSVPKKRFHQWCQKTFGAGISINPHVIAFLLVARVVNEFLRSAPGAPNGVLISDENKEVARDVETSIRALRLETGLLNLSQIIEKGFFIESHKSRLLQLADLCAYTARRREEDKLGLKIRELDRSGFPLIEPLIHRGEESLQDLLEWWTSEQKRGGRGKNHGVGKGPAHSGRQQ